MKELIEALKIFLKHEDMKYPTHCEHDILYVHYNPEDFSQEDIDQLEVLGFTADYEEGCFTSTLYGS